ncbi:MAG: repressor LexA [Clostridium sp. SCN 57-10]|nr:MAG: repressor LexA [Clostridium sp. SCN 57-10]
MKKLSPKRIEILEYLSSFTEQNGYPPSIREICEAVHLRSPSTVHAHIKVLKEGGYLEKDDRKTRAISVRGSRQPVRNVPVLGLVTAGAPILAQQMVEGYVPYIGGASGELFALTVRGDSMINAAILEDDVVIVKRTPSADNGDIVVALLGDEATVKRLSRKNGHVRLMPENPAYEPIDGDECTILGVVVAVYRPHV